MKQLNNNALKQNKKQTNLHHYTKNIPHKVFLSYKTFPTNKKYRYQNNYISLIHTDFKTNITITMNTSI
jgi:hypothetical protein